MSDTRGDFQHLTGDLLAVFETVHTEDGWIISLEDALEGVSAEAAIWKPASKVQSIWEICNHLLTWTRDVTMLLRQQERSEPVDWPEVGKADEEAWSRKTADIKAAVADFRSELAKLSPEELMMRGPQGGSRLTAALNIYVHNAYHAGQIAKLRALYEESK